MQLSKYHSKAYSSSREIMLSRAGKPPSVFFKSETLLQKEKIFLFFKQLKVLRSTIEPDIQLF